jgi:hypothetical protein
VVHCTEGTPGRTVSALYSKRIQGIFLACNNKQRRELLTVEPKKKRHIMLLKRCRGSAWLKALVSSVYNLPLLRFSCEICSPTTIKLNHNPSTFSNGIEAEDPWIGHRP